MSLQRRAINVGGLSPVRAEPVPERTSGANVTFEPGSLEGVKNALLVLDERYVELDARASKNRAVVLNSYTREKAVQVLLKVCERVIA